MSNLELRRWLFEKLFKNQFLMHGNSYQTSGLELGARRRTAVHSTMLLGWLNLKMVSVTPKS